MTLLGKREVRTWSLFAVHVAGLDSGLDNFLQRAFWKQLKTFQYGLNKDDPARRGKTAGLGD